MKKILSVCLLLLALGCSCLAEENYANVVDVFFPDSGAEAALPYAIGFPKGESQAEWYLNSGTLHIHFVITNQTQDKHVTAITCCAYGVDKDENNVQGEGAVYTWETVFKLNPGQKLYTDHLWMERGQAIRKVYCGICGLKFSDGTTWECDVDEVAWSCWNVR